MLRALPLFALALFFFGCNEPAKLRALCASDQDCVAQHDGNPNWACDPQVGDCVCTADAACTGEAEHCEPRPSDGRCHPDETCEWNGDCPTGFCDTVSRFCRQTGCARDLQCGLGQVCESITQTCVPGCRSHGDCDLGQTCLCEADGVESACGCELSGDARSTCVIGACVPGTCTDDSFCRYGDRCIASAEGARATCEEDLRGPYCQNCVLEAGGGVCGSAGPNFCLLDTSDAAGLASFCGVDCSEDQPCPNGLTCHDVLRLTQSTCQGDAQCVATGGACSSEAECPAGSRCVKSPGEPTGRCGGRCAVGEGDQTGFCTCVADDDCPQQTCGSDGRCSVTRQRCVPGQNDSCRGQVRCVNNGELGYCKIGENCAPIEGVSCKDVRCAQDPTGCAAVDE